MYRGIMLGVELGQTGCEVADFSLADGHCLQDPHSNVPINNVMLTMATNSAGRGRSLRTGKEHRSSIAISLTLLDPCSNMRSTFNKRFREPHPS